MQHNLTPAVRNDFVELIAANFRTDEINELGRLLLARFDMNAAAGAERHVTVAVRKAARLLVEHCEAARLLLCLVELVVQTDGGAVNGRPIRLDGLECFLERMGRAGLAYDFAKRRVLPACADGSVAANWGCLKDGRTYQATVVSLDIVGNSVLVRRFGAPVMERRYAEFWTFLRRRLSHYNGRIWSWAGDGGILAFARGHHVQDAVLCAAEVQGAMPLFNAVHSDGAGAPLALRIGIDTGGIRFLSDTGTIVSEVINYAAHLEKKAALPGQVAISAPVRDGIAPALRLLFPCAGVFEERECFSTGRRLDDLIRASDAVGGLEDRDRMRSSRRLRRAMA